MFLVCGEFFPLRKYFVKSYFFHYAQTLSHLIPLSTTSMCQTLHTKFLLYFRPDLYLIYISIELNTFLVFQTRARCLCQWQAFHCSRPRQVRFKYFNILWQVVFVFQYSYFYLSDQVRLYINFSQQFVGMKSHFGLNVLWRYINLRETFQMS